MKRIIVAAIFFVLGALQVFAAEQPAKIDFLYINGSNNNTPSMEKWFFDGVDKLHPQMKANFEKSPFVADKLLKNGNLVINDEPKTFFWGDKTLNDLATVTEELNMTSIFSPFLAQKVRSFFAHCMHDAIWVQKDHNMQKIVKDLHREIITISKRGEKAILFGYSAGSFVTYEYLFYKLPVISFEKLPEKLNLHEKERAFVKTKNIKSTCLDAVTASTLAIYSTSGLLIANPDFESFKKAYLNLDKYTDEYCTPDGTVLGVVNYASPLVLFYSDLRDPTLEINQFNKDLFVYMKNKDIFMLTVNFADDPLGYPVSKNLNLTEIEGINHLSFNDEGRGFFHDKSNVKSPATFLGAHTSYWNASKKFSKAVADAYMEGYLNFYSDIILKNEKK